MKEKIIAFFSDGQWIESITPMAINIISALAIFIIGRWVVSKLVKVIKTIMDKRDMDDALTSFITSILSFALTFMVALMAVEQLGVNTTSFFAVLGAAGLAVGLALKDSLSNFAAGVMLIIFKPFTTGNYVSCAGIEGSVEAITVFNTIFNTVDNKKIIVPNAQIYSGVIVNFSAKPTRRVDMVIGVSYDDDLKKAKALMEELLNNDERVLQNPAPVVAVDELADSSVNFVVRPWVKSADYWAVKWDFLQTVKETFDANGISIPYPQTDLHLHKVEK